MPTARFYREAKILEIGEGASQIQRMVIARSLGLPVARGGQRVPVGSRGSRCGRGRLLEYPWDKSPQSLRWLGARLGSGRVSARCRHYCQERACGPSLELRSGSRGASSRCGKFSATVFPRTTLDWYSGGRGLRMPTRTTSCMCDLRRHEAWPSLHDPVRHGFGMEEFKGCRFDGFHTQELPTGDTAIRGAAVYRADNTPERMVSGCGTSWISPLSWEPHRATAKGLFGSGNRMVCCCGRLHEEGDVCFGGVVQECGCSGYVGSG